MTGSQVVHATATAAPLKTDRPQVGDAKDAGRPWQVVVWNDPINLMTYVVYVFRKLFGFSEAKATKLMLAVHHEGRTVVTESGIRGRPDVERFAGTAVDAMLVAAPSCNLRISVVR